MAVLFGVCVSAGAILIGLGTKSWKIGIGVAICVAPINYAALYVLLHLH